MTRDPGKLIVGLAAAVGTALLLFARKHGEPDDFPELPADADAVDRAELELANWRGLTETDRAAAPLLARYWKAVGVPPQPPGTAWSAAFISYLAGPSLPPNAAHIGYTRAAYRARESKQPGRYWAFQPSELPLQRGDILIRARAGSGASWQDVLTGTAHKDTHGDLVAERSAGMLRLIGGNVSNAVTEQRVPYGAGDALPGVFAVLRKVPLPGGEV